MKLSQIVLIAGATLFVIVLFSMPKVIVDNKKGSMLNEMGTQPLAENIKIPDVSKIHKSEIPEKAKEKLNFLTNSYKEVSNNKKKIIFADSLVALYRTYYQYDSAAKYAEEISLIEPNLKNWEKTGDVFSEAANFSAGNKKEFYADKARAYYKFCLDKNPSHTDVKVKLALTYIGGKNTMEGVVLLREVVEKDPNNEKALFNLGFLSLQMGWQDKAVARFEQLIKVNPRHEMAHFYLGALYKEAGEIEKAKKHFQHALSISTDPDMKKVINEYLEELK
ncbi:MAG: tetratricopeptide repeat protein [Cytophagaceae bacterium]|nr:tetratricopeptide repeat protein [Cytophagaceae bacterium]MDW8456223.1 tetratricopeptide repeat protein [Cytophagaceae bacterium]